MTVDRAGGGQSPAAGSADGLPAIPASAGVLLFDQRGRLLVLKPTYKDGWTIPGGVMENTGESPWQAARREVAEECGLVVTRGRLVCVDTRPARGDRPLGLRFLFHCGRLDQACVDSIVVQAEEVSAHRFVEIPEALTLLRPPVRRRVAASWDSDRCLYLQDGRPVEGVC